MKNGSSAICSDCFFIGSHGYLKHSLAVYTYAHGEWREDLSDKKKKKLFCESKLHNDIFQVIRLSEITCKCTMHSLRRIKAIFIRK